jgi:4-hydroxy-L-threonine phosphate dehydrogenase PdxA
MDKPVLGITMGDPQAVGPGSRKRRCLKKNYKKCNPVMIEDLRIIEKPPVGRRNGNRPVIRNLECKYVQNIKPKILTK